MNYVLKVVQHVTHPMLKTVTDVETYLVELKDVDEETVCFNLPDEDESIYIPKSSKLTSQCKNHYLITKSEPSYPDDDCDIETMYAVFDNIEDALDSTYFFILRNTIIDRLKLRRKVNTLNLEQLSKLFKALK